MTTLGLSQTPPADPIAERVAANEQKRQALAADTAERARLTTADHRARLAYEEARGLDAKLLTDASARLDASDDDLATAPKSHRVARDTAVKAATALAEHIAQTGDLAARAGQIRDEAYVIAQDKFRMAHTESTGEVVRLGTQLAQALARVKRLERDAYAQFPDQIVLDGEILEKGAGLTPVGFPAGVFEPAQTALGPRSAWLDDVLVAVGIVYPDLLEMLPAGQSAEVQGKIETIRKNRVIWFAMQPGWRTAGGWQADIVDLTKILAGPFRRELHGL